jgi:hypothetical protein
MNPFVNLKKRSISLPPGCKDLIDVLNQPTEDKEAIGFVCLLLFIVQAEGASECVIGAATDEGTPFKYKVDGAWYENTPFPTHVRPAVMVELGRLAKVPEGHFPKEGVLFIPVAGAEVKWRLQVRSEGGECVLTRIDG